jgi:hypothetical protein
MRPEKKTQTVKTSRNLPCVLTDAEKLDYGRKLADAENELDTIDTEKKNAVDGYKEKTSAVQVAVRRLVSAIRDGMERREVECEWVYYWDSFTKELVRSDTGESIERAVIGPDERQIGLDGIDKNAE